jgi:hypothetical protein
MNCREFLHNIDGPEPPSPEGFEHLRGCSACREAFGPRFHLQQGMLALAEEWREIQAPSRVETALIAAYRAHTALKVRPAPPIPIMVLPVAAAVLIALALFSVQARRSVPQPQHRAVTELAIVQTSGLDASDPQSGFIPLPNAQQIDAGEQTDVVRVELPRSAMIELGYTVTADRAEEPVEADVMLGPDGVARAVRFLDEF